MGQEQTLAACPKCGTKVAEDALFCDCGEYLPEQTVCIDCGFISSRVYRECPRCGSEILGGSLRRLVIFSILISVLYWVCAALLSTRPGFSAHPGAYWTAAAGVWLALLVLDVGNWHVLRPRRKSADVFRKALAEAQDHESRERIVRRIQQERENLLENLRQLAVPSPEMAYLAARGGTIDRPVRAGLHYAKRALLSIAIVVMLIVVLERVCYERPIPSIAWIVAGVSAVIVTLMCFAYAYAGHVFGLKKARVMFLMIAGVILLGGVYFMTGFVMEIFTVSRAATPAGGAPVRIHPRPRSVPQPAPEPSAEPQAADDVETE